jgi:hypothetical protein
MAAAVLTIGTAPASAGPSVYTCTDGVIPGGGYSSLIVTGNCVFGGDVTVNGNIMVRRGAVLNDHAGSPAEHVAIHGTSSPNPVQFSASAPTTPSRCMTRPSMAISWAMAVTICRVLHLGQL